MRIIGVTGGVGSGKSAVLNYMEEHFDSRVVKADEVGHMLMMPGRECYEPVIQLFGDWVVREDTSLDRAAIASIVFDNPEMLKKLDENTLTDEKGYEKLTEKLTVYSEKLYKDVLTGAYNRRYFERLCFWKKNMMKFVMRYGIFIAKKKYAWKDCAETEAIQMRKSKS